MIGYAITAGIFARQNSLLTAQNFARQSKGCDNKISRSLSTKIKSPVINHRHNHGSAFGLGSGVTNESCALLRRFTSSSSFFNNNAVNIQTRRYATAKPYDIETNLPKDVILYKYENPKYFRRLNIFGFSQLIFWTYLAQFVFSELKDSPVGDELTEDSPWWSRINLGEKTNRIILTTFTFLVGYALFSLAWIHTLKSVRYLVLRKGGNDVTFVTYTPFGENRMRTVPLNKMTSKQSREAAKVQLPIKVKGDWMHYLMDMRGEFRHPKLFDFTAGLKRSI